MPRYFFHVRDGVDMPDAEGVDLADLHEAQKQAIRTAGDIIAEKSTSLKLGEDWIMEVTDDRGLILFYLDFHIAGSAATLGHEADGRASDGTDA